MRNATTSKPQCYQNQAHFGKNTEVSVSYLAGYRMWQKYTRNISTNVGKNYPVADANDNACRHMYFNHMSFHHISYQDKHITIKKHTLTQQQWNNYMHKFFLNRYNSYQQFHQQAKLFFLAVVAFTNCAHNLHYIYALTTEI